MTLKPSTEETLLGIAVTIGWTLFILGAVMCARP